jgi:hypothetical protein
MLHARHFTRPLGGAIDANPRIAKGTTVLAAEPIGSQSTTAAPDLGICEYRHKSAKHDLI